MWIGIPPDNMNEVESVEVGELGLSDDMEDESPPDAGPRAQPNQQSRPTPSPRVHPQPASRYMYRQRPSEQQQHATQQMQGQMYAQPPVSICIPDVSIYIKSEVQTTSGKHLHST